MADAFYAQINQNRLDNMIDWDFKFVSVALLNDTYDAVNGLANHRYYSDVAPFETSGTGYSAGGKTIATGISSDRWRWFYTGEWETDTPSGVHASAILNSSAERTWTSASFSVRWAAIYTQKTSGELPLIALLDLGETIVVNGDWTLPLREDLGIIQLNPTEDTFYGEALRRAMMPSNAMVSPTFTNPQVKLVNSAYVFDASHTSSNVPHVVEKGVTGGSVTIENGEHVVRFPGNKVTFEEITGTFRYVVIRQNGTTRVLALIDLGQDITVTNGTFVINAPDGFLKVVAI